MYNIPARTSRFLILGGLPRLLSSGGNQQFICVHCASVKSSKRFMGAPSGSLPHEILPENREYFVNMP
jgi:hypothetical protein